RLASGIVLVAIALASIMLGGDVWFGVVLAISLVGLYELYRVFHLQKDLLGILGYLFTVAYYALLHGEEKEFAPELLVGFLICLLACYVFAYPKYRTEQIMTALFGMVYVVFM